MSLPPATRAEIKRLFHAEHFSMNAIAEALSVHHDTVKDVLDTSRFNAHRVKDPGLIDPYLPFIEKAMETYPKLRATRVKKMIAGRGYRGSVETVRRALRQIRPRYMKAYLPMTMIDGEQAQIDWAHFGQIDVGDTKRKLSCFVMVLAYSRAIFAHFTFDQKMENFLRAHVLGFHYLGGVARYLLYDNLKSVVLERDGRHIKFHPTHLEFSGHYHFRAEACNPRSGWEKGRVERSIRYIRESFYYGRSFKDIDDLNDQLSRWLTEDANRRPWPDNRNVSVFDRWQEEKQKLLSLPDHDFPTDTIQAVRSAKLPYIRFDRNDYSIPYQCVGKPLTLVASEKVVRILDGDSELSRHERSYKSRERIKNDEHFAGLLDERRKAKSRSRRQYLIDAVPELAEFYRQLTGQGREGVFTRRLSSLYEEFGAEQMREAVSAALSAGKIQVNVLARILAENAQKNLESHQIDIVLSGHRHIRELTLNTPDLSTYDEL